MSIYAMLLSLPRVLMWHQLITFFMYLDCILASFIISIVSFAVLLLLLCGITSVIFEVRRGLQSKIFARYCDMAYSFHVKVYSIQSINAATYNWSFSVTKTKGRKQRKGRHILVMRELSKHTKQHPLSPLKFSLFHCVYRKAGCLSSFIFNNSLTSYAGIFNLKIKCNYK
jgi:hypothetical protein